MASDTDNRTYATGRRKTATARVWIMPGSGVITVNKVPSKDYFRRDTSEMVVREPLKLTGTLENTDIWCTVCGGGLSGQAGAVRHGIARALQILDPNLRGDLKKAGMLTRDSREKERKKPGQPGARKRFQFSKR
ncbi:SSU ribosomal protein S9p (S16e) [hydrothermal vent metagenome]|uniref:SSU ribosomal protein S9p (S16e) n=1 Tax=hydrothermal vent metagenome TaxID=652676 RepID=A0A3B1D3E0_9ZZZZ